MHIKKKKKFTPASILSNYVGIKTIKSLKEALREFSMGRCIDLLIWMLAALKDKRSDQQRGSDHEPYDHNKIWILFLLQPSFVLQCSETF
ncbi:hypothetical protein M0804_014059 [Polistes exclamans]|nr:hypothetical protein M0804_014059 [Polistes exclamans]